jgi:hypothetical protein
VLAGHDLLRRYSYLVQVASTNLLIPVSLGSLQEIRVTLSAWVSAELPKNGVPTPENLEPNLSATFRSIYMLLGISSTLF